ncbi:TPA: SGNH/GDSL hydrolase family protein [Vibrio harveyi]|nr:SGNH/GDSL hydrolase family protein [Vibrio harveyi]HDZ3734314.1 SGNH/GDSL hydrolase family protein [Vibrio harveyi]
MHPLRNGSQVNQRPDRKPTSGLPGYFTESGENNVPSYPGQDFFNDQIDEFLNALNFAGQTYDPQVTVNLSNALKSLGKRSLNVCLVSELEQREFSNGTLIYIEDKHGGSFWDVKENDRAISNIPESSIDFDDETTIHLSSGQCLHFNESFNLGLIKRKNAENYNLWFSKQKTRTDELVINCYGDSITFGQAQPNTPNSTNKTGMETNFGDGSTYQHWQFNDAYPKILNDALARSMTNNVVVNNLGYSGDRALTSYLRHRASMPSGISTVMLGINDCLFATSNGLNPEQLSNETNPWAIRCYSIMLRRFLMREVLRGNNVVFLSCVNFNSADGYDGTNASATKLTDAYNDAAASICSQLGVFYVDTRRDIINQYSINRFTQEGVHPSELGHKILGERFSSLFIGNGYLKSLSVSSGVKSIANQAITSINSKTTLAPISNSTSYSPPFNKAAPTAIAIPTAAQGPIVFSFYCEQDDLVIFPSFIANPATITMELDGGAEQQEYLVDYPSYQKAAYGTPDSYPGSIKTRTYSQQTKVNRRTVHYSDDSDMYIHVSGRGWHTLSFTSSLASTAFIDSIMFMSWDDVHQEIKGLTRSVVFDASSGVSIIDSFGIEAVTDEGSGVYALHYENDLLNGEYNIQANCRVSGKSLVLAHPFGAPTKSSVRVEFFAADGASWAPASPNYASVAIFGGR